MVFVNEHMIDCSSDPLGVLDLTTYKMLQVRSSVPRFIQKLSDH